MSFAIETVDLSRRFGALTAVDSLNLRVERGAVYGFLGPNGAGKTTTIRMLLDLIRPGSGTVRLFGEPFRRAALARVGSLVETPSLYPHLTGRENLEVARRLNGRTRAEIERALVTVGLADAAHRKVAGYSLGMRHRLGLALALLGNPELLVLDEPTNGLDPAGIREMRELIRNVPREWGTTVFLSSHLLAEVEQVATHVGIIDKGRLRFEGRLAELHARMETKLEVRLNRPLEAIRVLSDADLPAEALDGDGLMVPQADAAIAARVNEMLVTRGFSVHHLQVQSPSLEEIFFAVTEKGVGQCAIS